jgi:integrase
MAEFGLYTGQRLADIAALTWDNLDLSKNEIRLRTRKTGKRIMVPIAKPLRQRIDSLQAGVQPGTPIHPRAFTIINRHGRSANLSNHFADLLAQAGLREKGAASSEQRKGSQQSTSIKQSQLSFTPPYSRELAQGCRDSGGRSHGARRARFQVDERALHSRGRRSVSKGRRGTSGDLNGRPNHEIETCNWAPRL